MGKIKDDLIKQLDMAEYKEDAEKCLKIYDKLYEIFDGHVWGNEYGMLVRTTWLGIYPECTRIQKPSKIGEVFLNGINK